MIAIAGGRTARGRFGRPKLGRGLVVIAALALLSSPSFPSFRPADGFVGVVHADDLAVPERLERFRASVRNGSFVERLAALGTLSEIVDPRTVEAVMWAAALFTKDRAAVASRLLKDESADIDAAESLERARRVYERQGSTGVAFERWQKERSRLEELRRGLATSIGDGRTAQERLGRLLERTQKAATIALTRVSADDFESALEFARAGWLRRSGATFDDKRRFVDALTWIRRPGVEGSLRALVDDPLEDVRVRKIALAARAERHDDGVIAQATALLEAPSWVLRAAAIEAMRVVHDPAAIEPLIAFLARKDLGRLREDARAALGSLTGESHGPFAQPWDTWWKAAKAEFEMPRRPAPVAPPGGADATASFYGISTFSTHVLFVVDVSSSMADVHGALKTGERKIDVARRELDAALGSLDDGSTFGVFLFNGDVTVLPGGVVKSDAASRAKSKAFVASVEPEGPTNVMAALDEAFALAGASVDPGNPSAPSALPIDTIFFLTDGRPSVGRTIDPEVILGAVARMRREIPVVVHAIGIGDHDPQLLRRLAESTGGRYVKR